MTFSYDITEDTSLDRVRGIVGDTEDAGHLIEDETITAALTRNGDSVFAASIEVCRMILAKLAKHVDRSHPDGISTSRSQRFTHYKDLIADLRERMLTEGGGCTAFAGGTSKAENDAFDADSDNVGAHFDVGMWSRPPAGGDGR